MLVAAAPGRPEAGPGTSEGRRALRALGSSYLSVAELAVALGIPLGTAEVVVADLTAAGHVQVFGTTPLGPGSSHGDARHRTLLLLGSVIDGIGEL